MSRGCEVCGEARASDGWLVAGRAFEGEARLTLCSACQSDLGLAAEATAGRPIPWRAVAWLAAAVGIWALHIVTPYGHFLEGAAAGLSLVLTYLHSRREEAPALEPVRRPAVEPALADTMSNSQLLAHLRAVSDFPEEDFIMMRPNSKRARILQRERAEKQCPVAVGKLAYRRSELVCSDPAKNGVVTDATIVHHWQATDR